MNTTAAATALALSATSTYYDGVGLSRPRSRRGGRTAHQARPSRHRFRSQAPTL